MQSLIRLIDELKSLSKNRVLGMAKIEWWLMKHEKIYAETKRHYASKHLYVYDERVVRLPDNIGSPTNGEKFIDVYESFNELANRHKNEVFFKQQLAIYKTIKNQPIELRQWIKKNEGLIGQDYSSFFFDYFEYDTEEKVHHLNLFFLNNNDLDIYVNRNDFKNTIEFLELFETINNEEYKSENLV